LYVDGKKKKSWPTDGLALGQETSGSMNIDKLSAEEYPVTVKTDATGAISESNEGNNEYSKTVTVTETKKPDLTPYNISWEPSSPSTSDNIAIIWKVRNQGNADAVGRFYTELYVDDEYKARWYKDGLAAGDEVYDARYIGTLSAGNHMVTVVTDTNGTIDECNESNNKYDVSLAVTKAKELDLTPYRFVTKWGRLVSGDGRLSSPEGIAVDISGYVYVADSLYKRIQKFDSYGNFITKWGSSGNGDGQFIRPQGIAVDRHRCVYVADSYNNQIQKFYSQGTFIRKWGSSGNGDGQFSSPVGIAVDSNLNVYVADKGNGRIQKFDYHGNFITKWGSNGTRDGQFYSPYGPHGIAVDSSGNVYVTDYGNDRIQKFDSNGKFITKWESHGSGDGHFYSPYGIAVDSSGNVFVVDPNNNRIQKFDSSGKFITKWGSHGTGNGQFISPESIAVDSSGNVYVADYYTGLIQKFAPCTPTPTSENGGTGFDDAIELSDGQTLSGEVVKGEEDYYKFYLNEGQEATVTMQPLDDDQDLYIYN
ncbi:MAG: 6-bladed beta-propeller, partial [Dehalococcoidia bacterium]|nr:6-bladed beta-propeller [Dehalococcoidia bacterium]